jgi:hypothetical protein
MKMKALGVAACFALGILTFQNCSQVAFNTAPPTASKASLDEDPTVVDIETVPDSQCKSFVELNTTSGQILDIPARSSAGVCFLAKIISAVKYDEFTNSNRENDVISRNHDAAGGSDSTVIHSPYVLGSKLVRVILHGQRSVKLSGGKNDTSEIHVDNFILVGLAPSAQIGTPSFYKAYGTTDSSLPGTNHVLFKNQEVVVKGFMKMGTSSVDPVPLEGSIELSREYTLDVRALDAGGLIGETSDIYLLFK